MSDASLTPPGPAPITALSGTNPRKPPLPALTGLRTLLALNIVFFHFTPPHMTLLYPVINNAYVFVGFFFMLSGFVLSYNYGDQTGRLIKRDFWKARFARVYPVYLLSLVLSFQMLGTEWHARSHGEFWAGTVLTPLLLQGWSPALATFWNTVAWTLSSEVVLYAAFPWLIRLPWPKSALRLAAMLLGIWVLGLVPHWLYMLLNPDHLAAPANRYSSGLWLRALKYTPLSYVCTFLAGVTLGRLQAGLALTNRQRSLIVGGSLAALALFFAVGIEHVPYVLMHGGLLVPLFAALVLGLSGQSVFAAVLAWGPLVLFGRTSYCLYLLHFNLINAIRLYRLPERLHVVALDPWISYVAALLVAFAATYLVERPLRRVILHGRGYGRSRAVASTTG